MNLWLIRTELNDISFLVRADNEEEARGIVDFNTRVSYGASVFGEIWLNSGHSTCEKLTEEGPGGVVLEMEKTEQQGHLTRANIIGTPLGSL